MIREFEMKTLIALLVLFCSLVCFSSADAGDSVSVAVDHVVPVGDGCGSCDPVAEVVAVQACGVQACGTSVAVTRTVSRTRVRVFGGRLFGRRIFRIGILGCR